MSERITLALILILVGVGLGVVIANLPQGGTAASVRDEHPAVREAAIRAMGWPGDANRQRRWAGQ